jgi:hypothetical protein
LPNLGRLDIEAISNKKMSTPGAIFRTFFPRKVIFRGIFLGISWGKNFSKLFPRKIPIFPKIFPRKHVRKIGPCVCKFLGLLSSHKMI